ncbi:hypothetical protein Mgra_00002492 [Meloidogyne graminicola]|uniref:DNA mismatch repair protein S5 domain-containing protein n=1 Tax=Meloidogyne graminicola TaxID=189291 RepID=A0A8S9ZY28_9BILA|nr:hypothetical protein Mgra_00002492 [Meloidogyne graminicola]
MSSNHSITSQQQITKIHELPKEISHRICTGLVILDLAGACRELIDNALDANSTNIEIKTVENGTELLEVIDNGNGIIPEDFDKICILFIIILKSKPHCTSKLTNFEDFSSLSTFGFRGEALNALANTSQIQITTRDENSKCGCKLTFDRNGEILKKEQCSRQAGSTVSITNIFKNLPVRRQELLRSSRRELLKLIECVQAFAISHPNCRFNCSNIVNGKYTQLISSPGGNTSLIDVIINLLGISKNELIELSESNPEEEIQQIYKINSISEEIYQKIKLTGYVSSFEFGRCRIIKEKHFIYVNGRHIESQRLSRISNDLFGQFNKCGQRCILILFISLPSSTLDVNVTPDKRTLFLHFEKELFAKLHSTLISTFSKVQGNCSSSIVEDLIQNKSYSLSKSNRLFYDFNSSTNLLNNLKKLEKNNSENSQSSPLNSTQSTKPINKTTPIKNILSISSSSSSSSSPEHSPLNSTKNSDLISSPTFSEQNNNSSLLPITSSPSLNINYRPHQTIKINMEELKNKYLKRHEKRRKK